MYDLQEIKNPINLKKKIELLNKIKEDYYSNEDRHRSFIAYSIMTVIYGGLYFSFSEIPSSAILSVSVFAVCNYLFQFLRNKHYISKNKSKFNKFIKLKTTLFLNKNHLEKFHKELNENQYHKEIINDLNKLEFDKNKIYYKLLEDRINKISAETLNDELEDLEEIIEDCLPEDLVWDLYDKINKKLDLYDKYENTESNIAKENTISSSQINIIKPKKRKYFEIKSI